MFKKGEKNSWFKRHKIITVFLAFILIIVIASSASDSKTTSTSKSAKTESKASTVSIAKIGEEARDGKFEFTIKAIKCGVPSVSDSTGYLSKTAQGQYCFLTINVKNIGDKQQFFLESNQKLLNAENLEYSTDTTATLYNSNNSDVFISQINPGNSVEGVIIFDIPKDQSPVTAELHDSAYSGGVKVTLQ